MTPQEVKTYAVKPQGFSRGARRPRKRKLSEPVYQAPLMFVTSFSPAGYKDYGKRFLESFVRFFPQNAILACFYEHEKPPIDDSRIWYFDLLEDKEYEDWMIRHGSDPEKNGIRDGVRDFRFDAVRFAPKIFSLTSPVLPHAGWRIWIDADVEATEVIPESFFSKLLRTDAVAAYLGRPKEVFATSECGFVAYKTSKNAGRQFLLDLRTNYVQGKIFGFPEWHDSAVFDILRQAYEQAGATFKDLASDYYKSLKGPLTFEEHGHPWPNTPLGRYLTHYKGLKGKERAVNAPREVPDAVDLQRLCSDPSITSRYQQIERILMTLPHEVIVEVGVAQGEGAVRMAMINLRRGKKVKYIGFDLFESIKQADFARELNGKNVGSKDLISQRLDRVKMDYPQFEWELVKGDTRETLPAYKFDEVDFAFIDGGHSIETIASDFKALRDVAKLIVLDDYYESGVDTSKFGCNSLIDSIPNKEKTLLPKVDAFAIVDKAGNKVGEQKIRMAATGEILRPPGESTAIKIKTRNCVPDEEIQGNIRNAFRYKDRAVWLPAVCRPSEDRVLFVGGSPTVTNPNRPEYAQNWALAKGKAAVGDKVVVCKTAYKHALDNGIVPWGCVLLDPRDHVAQWIDPVDERVLFFVASMCHPSTWEHIDKPNVKIFGYHAGVGAQEGKVVAELWGDAPLVHGGTTSSFRGISLLHAIGFRHFETIGLDSSYPEKPEKLHGRSEKPLQNITIGADEGMERRFWTDPELIAQSQDAEALRKVHPSLDIRYLGDGLLQHAQKVLTAMIARAGPLKAGPRDLMAQTWLQLFRSGQHVAEAIYVEDMMKMVNERAVELRRLLGKQPAFADISNAVMSRAD